MSKTALPDWLIILFLIVAGATNIAAIVVQFCR